MEHQPKSNLIQSSLKIWHLVATVSRISWWRGYDHTVQSYGTF